MDVSRTPALADQPGARPVRRIGARATIQGGGGAPKSTTVLSTFTAPEPADNCSTDGSDAQAGVSSVGTSSGQRQMPPMTHAIATPATPIATARGRDRVRYRTATNSTTAAMNTIVLTTPPVGSSISYAVGIGGISSIRFIR